MFVGGETTGGAGSALTATLYFLGREPEKLERLRADLRNVETANNISRIALKEVQRCQCLQAFIKESLENPRDYFLLSVSVCPASYPRGVWFLPDVASQKVLVDLKAFYLR